MYHRDYQRRRLETSKARPLMAGDDPRHGTVNGYTNLHCRCNLCRRAQREAQGGSKSIKNLTALRRQLALEPSLETQFGDLAGG